VDDAAQLLALVVLLSDEYVQFKQGDELNRKLRFFQLNLRLPLELQTRICNLAFEYDSVLISSKCFYEGLKAALRLFWN